MKSSEILRLAAERISDRKEVACCYAIVRVGDETFSVFEFAQSRFHDLFSNGSAFWFGMSFSEEEQNHRVIALLLTADIFESEGD